MPCDSQEHGAKMEHSRTAYRVNGETSIFETYVRQTFCIEEIGKERPQCKSTRNCLVAAAGFERGTRKTQKVQSRAILDPI